MHWLAQTKTMAVSFAAFAIGGCATHRVPLAVEVRALQDTVAFQRNLEATFFSVTAVVQNRDARAVYVSGCGPAAQREIDGTWTTVFSPVCVGSSAWIVMPGDSVNIPVTLYGFTSANMLPKLDPRADSGRYRLVFFIGPTDPAVGATSPPSTQQVTSSPFILRD
jgi:hypothetical protein